MERDITDLITAWIAKDDDAFKTMFDLTMKETEVYIPFLISAKKEHPSKKRQIRKLGMLYANAVSAGGDMSSDLAESLLDDLSTDGKQLHSSQIQQFGTSSSPSSSSTAWTSLPPPSPASTAGNRLVYIHFKSMT